mgnify:CR=1 FL=1
MSERARVWCVAAAGVAMAGLLFLPQRRMPSPPAPEPQWRTVATWSGTGDRTLEVATGDRWRVRCRSAEGMLLVVRPEHQASETIYCAPGRERVQELGGAGLHRITIEGSGAWEVGVEERWRPTRALPTSSSRARSRSRQPPAGV